MARKKNADTEEPMNPMGWMVTFSDLVTLLLTFFVLLISMSSMDVKSVTQAFGLFSAGSGVLEYSKEGTVRDLIAMIERPGQPSVHDLMENKRIKEEIFKFEDDAYQRIMDLLAKDIELRPIEGGVAIELANYILFDEGNSQLRIENIPVLHKIAEVLRTAYGFPVSIDGHTDGSDIEGGITGLAWELSLARAIGVLEFFTLEEGLSPDRFRVGGFGPVKQIYLGNTPEDKSKNRRIEIIIYRERFG